MNGPWASKIQMERQKERRQMLGRMKEFDPCDRRRLVREIQSIQFLLNHYNNVQQPIEEENSDE